MYLTSICRVQFDKHVAIGCTLICPMGACNTNLSKSHNFLYYKNECKQKDYYVVPPFSTKMKILYGF